MDIDNNTGLFLVNRKISQEALDKLFITEKYKPVTLNDYRLDAVVKQSVGVVIFGRGKSRPSSTNESGMILFITDLRGNTGTLELLNNSKMKFRGIENNKLEGIVVYLLHPHAMIDPQRPDTLLFQIKRQQDIIIVGKCPSFGKCDGTRRDGKKCTMPVDTLDSRRCKYHKLERTDDESRKYSNMITKKESMTSCNNKSSVISSTNAAATPKEKSSQTNTKVTSTPIDYLQQALQPDVNAPVIGTSLSSKRKFSSICPSEEIDGNDGKQKKTPYQIVSEMGNNVASITPLNKRSSYDDNQQRISALSTDSITDHKDGSVSVPKESKVFKVLSEKYYNNLAKVKQAQSAATALQHTASCSRIPSSSIPTGGNGILSNRHSAPSGMGSSNHNAILDKAAKEKIQNFSNMRCVGGQLFDLDKTRKNARLSNKKKVTEEKTVQEAKQRELDLKIESLLKRESSHQAEAEEDEFKNQMERLDRLSKREYMVQKDEKIHSLSVRAFQCLACNEISETMLDKCRRSGHPVTTISVIKRFYECMNCEKRESTLGANVRLPKNACLRCNEYKWRPCGKRKTSFETSTKPNAADKLVVSMSADTERYDVDRVQVAKSTLDQAK